MHEAVVHATHGYQLAELECLEESRGHVKTPARLRVMLLIHRQSLGQPARYAVVRHAERERVRQLVPHGRAPVERTGILRRGRIEGERRSEAHAERAETG